MDSALPVFVPPLAAAIAAVIAAGLAWAIATPLIRAADAPALPERLLQWAGQHRFVALLAYLPALFSGRHAFWALPAGLARPPDHDASRAPAGVRRHVELRGPGVVERPRLPRHGAWWWTLMIFPRPPGRHRGRARRDDRPRRRAPRLALLLQRRARRDPRRTAHRRARAARRVRADPGQGAGPAAAAGPGGPTRRPADQRLRAWRRARRRGAVLRRPAG